MPKGKVVEVVSSLCSMISAKLFGEDLLLLQVCKRELILVAKLIKRMWIMYEMTHTISLAAAVAAVTPSLVWATWHDDLDDEDQILQQNQSTSERRESVTDLLNKRKDLKLAAKTRPEKRKLNYAEEDIQLKRKLIERMDKSDLEFQENLERINKTIENIGHSVQQNVRLLVQNVNTNNEMVPKNSNNTFS